MTARYKLPATAQAATDLEDDLWEAYYAEEIAARGLADGASLDMRNGVQVFPPITTRYAVRTRVPGRAGGVIELDDTAQGWHGRTVRVRTGGTRPLVSNDGSLIENLPIDVQTALGYPGSGQGLRPDDVGRRRFTSRGFDPGSVRRALQRPFEGPSTLEWPTRAAMLLVALWSIVVLLARHCG